MFERSTHHGRCFALAILLIVVNGWPVRADDPAAGLERADHLSYLMFADLLPEAAKWSEQTRVVCFATELNEPTAEMPKDASEALVASLRTKFSKTYPNFQFLRRSQCATRYNDDIIYLVAISSDAPGFPECNGYEAFYSMGGWGGKIHVYRIRNDGDAPAIERTSCEMSGLIAAP